MRLTTNLEEMPHTTQMNLSPTNMFKGDSYHPKQATCLTSHSNNNGHRPRKAVKKTPSSMDQDTKEEEVLRIILQAEQTACHKDQPLQHLHHKLEDHHKLPQSTIKTEINRIHQNAMEPSTDPPEHLQMTKAQELLKQQPADSSRNTIMCSACGESGHWSRNCPYYNFCDFCRVTTHSTHMCRAAKRGTGSPVCISCGKANHSSAYCRYRPRDN